jgi:hypothetical protein
VRSDGPFLRLVDARLGALAVSLADPFRGMIGRLLSFIRLLLRNVGGLLRPLSSFLGSLRLPLLAIGLPLRPLGFAPGTFGVLLRLLDG